MPPDYLLHPSLVPSLIAAAALGTAGALLSVFIVSRRWVFIGEGIAHAGLGGAGTALLLAMVFPFFATPWVSSVAIVLFCLATAGAIGYFSRGQRLHVDTAIGIFMVAALAWGFLARQLYLNRTHHAPGEFDTALFGQMGAMPAGHLIATVAVAVVVVLCVTFLGKEILFYCFDPLAAQTAGVRAGFIHYLLIILAALTIIVGVPIVGSVMVTAMLVLPGATAMLLTKRLGTAITLSLASGLIGSVGGLAITALWRFLPAGPMIVLVLFILFMAAWIASHTKKAASPFSSPE